MKQITLEARPLPVSGRELCTGKLLFVWAAFGYAMAWLWSIAGDGLGAHLAVWSVATVLGAALALSIARG